MLVAGLRRHHETATADIGIARQWREFLTWETVPGRVGTQYFGVICGADDEGLEYMTGVEVESFDGLAAETGRLQVPGQRYAVFRCAQGPFMRTVWTGILAWLSSGLYESAQKPDFEVYRDTPDPPSIADDVEIWVGVVERGVPP
jgi:AraC family transcriptional regulator